MLALALFAPALAAANVPTQAAGYAAPQAAGGRAVEPALIWTAAGAAAGAILFSIFYLLKRRVGGFPRNPQWIAPITIMPSKDFPDEGTFPDAPLDPHGPSHH